MAAWGGFAHIKTLIDRIRKDAGGTDKTLTLDGGDTWQGSGTSLWTRGVDMVEACNILGVNVMVGHWEFTYPEAEVLSNVALFKGRFHRPECARQGREHDGRQLSRSR